MTRILSWCGYPDNCWGEEDLAREKKCHAHLLVEELDALRAERHTTRATCPTCGVDEHGFQQEQEDRDHTIERLTAMLVAALDRLADSWAEEAAAEVRALREHRAIPAAESNDG